MYDLNLCFLSANMFFYSATNVSQGRNLASSTITRPLGSDDLAKTDGSPGSVNSQPIFCYPGNCNLILDFNLIL